MLYRLFYFGFLSFAAADVIGMKSARAWRVRWVGYIEEGTGQPGKVAEKFRIPFYGSTPTGIATFDKWIHTTVTTVI